jgi:hypothetical protein
MGQCNWVAGLLKSRFIIPGHAGLKPTRRSLTAAFMLMGVATAVQADEILYVSNQGEQRGTGTIDPVRDKPRRSGRGRIARTA